MMKQIEFNRSTNHINMIFHDPVAEDYELLEGYEIIDAEVEQAEDGGWYVKGFEPPKSEMDQLKDTVAGQQVIIDELLFTVIPSLIEQTEGAV